MSNTTEKRKYEKSGKFNTGKKGARKKHYPRSVEAFSLLHMSAGSIFYSEKMDREITAIAHYYGKKILTKRVLIVVDATLEAPTCKKITQVTIL